MEFWGLNVDIGLILFFGLCQSYKNRSISTKPIIPILHYSNTPWHSSMAEPIISDLAQLPARRAYSPEGGPGFQCWVCMLGGLS
jgi:hypothetical protein